MRDVAHIRFDGGGLIVPAQTGYDRELLMEHIEVSTKRYGSVRLEVDRRHYTISLNDGDPEICVSCSRCPVALSYRLDGQTLCGQCAHGARH
jgi:hypothetical protein